jgi:ATP-binding cassette subfamily C (CFTR/MRP) protein 4
MVLTTAPVPFGEVEGAVAHTAPAASTAPTKSVLSPLERAGWLSRLTFWWVNPLMSAGAKMTLTEEHLSGFLPRADTSANTVCRLEDAWNCELEKETPSLARAYWMAYRWPLFSFGHLLLIEGIAEVAGDIVQGIFAEKLTSGNADEVWFLGSVIVVLNVVKAATHALFYFESWRFGLKLRTATTALMYAKVLRLKLSSLNAVTTGYVTNLISNDIERFQKCGNYCHHIWVAPMVGVAVIVALWVEIGQSAGAGVVLSLVMIAVQIKSARAFGATRKATSTMTDARVKATTQAIQGASLVKMQTWEPAFSALISRLRESEVSMVLKANLLRAANAAMYFSTGALVSVATLGCFHLLGNELTPRKIYTCMGLFISFQLFIGLFLVSTIESFSEGYVTIRRVQEYLLLAEQPVNATESSNTTACKLPSVRMNHACASWTEGQPTIRGVSLDVEGAKLLAVIGEVGCGKSSLLQAILKELPLSAGTLEVSGTVRLLAQEPWIMTGTVRDNICFGLPCIPEKFDSVLAACSLLHDMQKLPNGVDTVLGEKGLMLSGGQKARIGFARLCYCDADVLLLDDPLSAVDTKVGNALLTEGINGYLKNKLRVLVTHQLQYLKSADQIVLLQNGEIAAIANSYDELRGLPAFQALNLPDELAEGGQSDIDDSLDGQPSEAAEAPSTLAADPDEAFGGITKNEDSETGAVTLDTYLSWCRAGGHWGLWAVAGVMMLSSQGSFRDCDSPLQNSLLISGLCERFASAFVCIFGLVGFAAPCCSK